MTRSVTIFGTIHDLQGAEKRHGRKIEDPGYLKLLKSFLDGKDFVFEEASELGPTTAEHLAAERLGVGHYLDIDPHQNKRFQYSIDITGRSFPIDPCTELSDCYRQEFEGEHLKRENLWLAKIREASFENALFICGYLHTLSMAFRLRSEGFNVETRTYVPYLKLCPKPHRDE